LKEEIKTSKFFFLQNLPYYFGYLQKYLGTFFFGPPLDYTFYKRRLNETAGSLLSY